MKKLFREKKKHLLSFVMLLAILVLPALMLGVNHASADILTNINANLVNTDLDELGGANGDLPATIGRIVGVLLGLLGVVFVILVIYAGFMWMIAQGDQTKIDKARKTIIQGAIAIVIIFMAYAITTFVIQQIGSAAANQ